MFNNNHYDYDKAGIGNHAASLKEGAVLFRLTSLLHWDRAEILTGRGPEMSREDGRFNGPQQRTSYCANNVLVCIAEVLFHMYRRVLSAIHDHVPLNMFPAVEDQRALVAFRVGSIENLVWVDSEGVRVEYDPRICGTAVVYPDSDYGPFRKFSDDLRRGNKGGVLYPSARHSQDLCVALFDDQSANLLAEPFEMARLTLRLVAEDQDPLAPPRGCNPFKQKLHSTMGYYSFADGEEFRRLKESGLLNPAGLESEGMVDFVRRRYAKYPVDAVLRPSKG